MRRVDVDRIQVRVKGPAAGWTPAAAAALARRIAHSLAAGNGIAAGTASLGVVDAGSVRAAGGPTPAVQQRAADAVSASVSAAARGGR